MFSEEFTSELSAIQAAPFEKAITRAEDEAEIVLGSGRVPLGSIELAQELVAVVRDRADLDQFAGVPAPSRTNVLSSLKRLRARLEEYAAGATGAPELDKEVDQLHVLVWQNNLISSKGEKLFAVKNDQLERLKNKGRRINRELRKGITHRDTLKTAAEEIASRTKTIDDLGTQAQNTVSAIKTASTEASQVLTEIQQNAAEAKRIEQTAAQSLERTKAAENEVGALTEKVKLFHQGMDERTQELQATVTESKRRTKDLEGRSDKIIARHEELQGQIDVQLQKAAGASLFHAFQARQSELSKAKWVWAVISVVVLLFTVAWSVYLAQSSASLDTAFFVKLGGSLPVLALVVFCLSQYGRERRAEEEYAFKSALSLSLVPYKDLIENLQAKDGDAEYAKFLTSTIGQIYTAPRLAKDTAGKAERSNLRVMELVNELVEKLVNR